MMLKIYQINLERDENNVAFEALDNLEWFQGSKNIHSAIYDKVYEGEVNCKDLEDVYRMFNIDKPEEYRGRSMSVSDVVEIAPEGEGAPTFYFCDKVGFAPVKFQPELTQNARNQNIKVVYCEPGKLARVAEIGTTLEDIQSAVGGCFETFYPFAEEVCIVCNDEGKYNGCLPNRAVYGDNKEIMDIIFGPFFICDSSGENFGSLSSEQTERYLETFRRPEQFLRVNGEIKAIPYTPIQEQER